MELSLIKQKDNYTFRNIVLNKLKKLAFKNNLDIQYK